ncbi:MAG: DUF6268 family outer membrane beta-barrel protein [Candidatus Neomarinimicrobiota bacterium]
MKTLINSKKQNVLLFVILMLCTQLNITYAQEMFGLSSGYEIFPYVELAEPIEGAPDLEIQASSIYLGAAFPLILKEGKIIVMNQLNYKRTDFNYRNLPDSDDEITQLHSIEYTMFMIDSLSEKWKMVAVVTPGIASDLESDFSSDDITISAVFGYIKTMNKNFDLGFGLAYMPDFGEPLPMPFVYVDWDINPQLNVNGILPSDLTLLYKFNPKIDLGLSLMIDGNRYHGDPDKFDVESPFLQYSEGTISPMVNIHLSKLIHLNVEGGYAFYRNFAFFDDDDEVQSLDLKRTGYLRARLVLGM